MTRSAQISNAPKTVEKALSILEELKSQPDGLSLRDLSHRLGMPKSTVYRLLFVLEQNRYVQQNALTGFYTLGVTLLELGNAYLSRLEIREVARPFAKRLAQISDETVHVALLDSADVIFIDRIESSEPLGIATKVGKRFPAHSTAVGKALLAYSSEQVVDEVIRSRGLPRQTPRTITDPATLKEHLKQVRARGYAVDDEEQHEWGRCVGVPILDFRGKPVAAISISGLSVRLTWAKIESLIAPLKETAVEISKTLGNNGSA